MAQVTINLSLPTIKVSAKAHQRIVAVVAALTAASTAVSQYGPGFGLPAADGVYVGSAIVFVATILRALFPADVTPTPGA